MHIRIASANCIIQIFVAASLILVGCSPPVASPILIQSGNEAGNTSILDQDLHSSNGSDTAKPMSGGMVSFDGSVFVAVSEINPQAWNQAGWAISDQSIDTDTQEVPENCTLYVHEGVDGQWVGRCRGKIIIPKDGAKHIAVMHTSRDGSTTLIQVAPPP